MKKSIQNLVYPRRCVFCGEFLDKNSIEDICPACGDKLPYTGKKCRTKGEFFAECLSPLFYEGCAGDALRRFKFAGRSAYAPQLGKMAARCARENGRGDWEVVTWVPISLRRIRKRGYCQAKLLAREAAKELGLDCVRALRKRRHTPPQSTLAGLAARKANISGAFAAVNRSRIEGRSVLLVDDVVTTGATLSECTRILLMAGAREVSCVTVCKAVKK